ncbi:MAG: DUF6969 family protein [Pseudomonadota bacterium]
MRSHPDPFAHLPIDALEAMAAAGRDVERARRALRQVGHNVVSALLEGQGPFYEWDHYPAMDVHDIATGAQYFYHAHPPDADFPEHGHFHCFLRLGETGSEVRDKRRRPVARKEQALAHLVAISMDPAGEPIRLFVVNRWMTGETWLKGGLVAALLDRFDVTHGHPCEPVNRWIAAMLRLFRPQIDRLLRRRDRCIADWRRRHPGRDALEDRRLGVLAQEPISVAGQIAAVERALAARTAGSEGASAPGSRRTKRRAEPGRREPRGRSASGRA